MPMDDTNEEVRTETFSEQQVPSTLAVPLSPSLTISDHLSLSGTPHATEKAIRLWYAWYA